MAKKIILLLLLPVLVLAQSEWWQASCSNETFIERHLCAVPYDPRDFWVPGLNDTAPYDPTTCGSDTYTFSCTEGFFNFVPGNENNTNFFVPCCPGYFCPAGFSCMIKCSVGGYCPSPGISYGIDPFCKPYLEPDYPVFGCGGAGFDLFCPSGYYCPNTTGIEVCPSGYYCGLGSSEPKHCAVTMSCPEGSSTPKADIGWFLFGLLIAALFGVILYVIPLLRSKKKPAEHDTRVWLSISRSDMRFTENIFVFETQQRQQHYMDVEFNNVLYTGHDDQMILGRFSGELQAFKVTGIMGPSGSGKSVLIKALANRLALYRRKGKFSGEVRVVNSVNMMDCMDLVGYVPREDSIRRNMTVRQILLYQALFLMDGDLRDRQDTIEAMVDDKLAAFELSKIANKVPEHGALSTGELRRLNILMEMILNPKILFLDEPLLGIDNSTAVAIMNMLRHYAQTRAATVCLVVNQPTRSTFELMDDVIVLDKLGHLAYNGSRENAERFFGVPFEHENPGDLILRRLENNLVRATIYQDPNINNTDNHEEIHAPLATRNIPEGFECGYVPRRPVSFFKQLIWIISRQAIQSFYDYQSWLAVVLVFVVEGILLGFFQNSEIEKIPVSLFILSVAVSITANQVGLRSFGGEEELPARNREFLSGLNVPAYFIGKDIASLLNVLLYSAVFSISYLCFARPRMHIYEFFIIIAIDFYTCFGLSHVIAIGFSPQSASVAAMFAMLAICLASGFEPSKSAQPSVAFLFDLSFLRWLLESLILHETQTLSPVWSNFVNGTLDYYEYDIDNQMLSLGVVLAFGAGFRLLAFLILLFKAHVMRRGPIFVTPPIVPTPDEESQPMNIKASETVEVAQSSARRGSENLSADEGGYPNSTRSSFR